MTDTVDIVLVDDHPMLAAGLQARLAEYEMSIEAAPDLDEEAIIDFVRQRQPKLVVLDHVIPPLGFSTVLIEPLRALGPHVVVLTGSNDDVLWGQLLSLGAEAVLGKDEPLESIIDDLRSVCDGQSIRASRSSELRATWLSHHHEACARLAPFQSLSEREAEVLWALYEGHNPAQIAEMEFVSLETVRSQLKSAYRKLGVASQIEVLALIRHVGWFPNAQVG